MTKTEPLAVIAGLTRYLPCPKTYLSEGDGGSSPAMTVSVDEKALNSVSVVVFHLINNLLKFLLTVKVRWRPARH